MTGIAMMIVDDSNIIRKKITRSSHSDKFDVVATAANGTQALQMFEDTQPQLVTMDLTMPEMDGVECISKLIEKDPEVRILVVSALSDKATGIKALKKGARGFLCKPFSEQQLYDALLELMDDVDQ